MQPNTEETHMIRAIFIASVLLLSGCQSAYYAAWEKVGVEKRDILVDRVEDAKSSQQQAQVQFTSALEQLSQLIEFDGGKIQATYENLKDEYESSQASADRVRAHIDKVEDVANALFDEWSDELTQYKSEKLRRDSERKLKSTERKYQSLLRSMRRAESKMEPVLAALNDNALYLKHNLNAAAIGALQGEFDQIKNDIRSLLDEMNTAIEQSNAFIDSIQQGS